MEIQLLTQPELSDGKPFVLGETITSILTSKKPKYKTATFIFGVIKPDAIEYLTPYLKTFIENNGTVNFYIDANKRMSSNNLTADLINLGCNIFVFNNQNNTAEFQYRGCFFESAKKADFFLTSGNLSMNGLFEAFNIVTHLSYETSSEEYSEFTGNIFNESFLSNFNKLDTPETIYDEESWHLVKNSNNSFPSISEFTHKNNINTEKVLDDSSDSNILIEIDDSVDFYIPEELPKEPKKAEVKTAIVEPQAKTIDKTPVLDYPTETIYYNTDSAIDIEDFLFESQPRKITRKTVSKIDMTEQVAPEPSYTIETPKNRIIAKTAASSKTAIFMFEAAKITKRGVCAGEIKIPIYLRDSIADFWDWPTKFSLQGHAKIKSRICTFDIVDTKNPDIKIKDINVKLFQREDESSFSIHSKELETLDIAENDIIRLIKIQDISDTYYTCEVVRSDSKEYSIWEQFCTNEMKNSKRKYGIM